jgi:hypothetical protein
MEKKEENQDFISKLWRLLANPQFWYVVISIISIMVTIQIPPADAIRNTVEQTVA